MQVLGRVVSGATALFLGACSVGPPQSPGALPALTSAVGLQFEELARYPSNSPFASMRRFPLGVWLESVDSQFDVDLDRDAGINVYVGLTKPSRAGVVEASGMPLIAQQNEWLDQDHPAIDGWLLGDEFDMTMEPYEAYRALDAAIARLPSDRRLTYVNYGKGVAFGRTDEEASRFVNDYGSIVSVDTYWFTDENICGPNEGARMFTEGDRALTPQECHRAANYGATVRRVRDLNAVGGRGKPVWAFVEVGHPASENDWPTITPEQVKAAVWHSIIGGAQGIVYFNHSFGGPNPTQHALRDGRDPANAYAPIRAAVTAVNAAISELAPVLNSATVIGYAQADNLRLLTKKSGNGLYVFAGSDGSSGEKSIRVASGSSVEVVGEQRFLTVRGGKLIDMFDSPNTVHIYRIT